MALNESVIASRQDFLRLCNKGEWDSINGQLLLMRKLVGDRNVVDYMWEIYGFPEADIRNALFVPACKAGQGDLFEWLFFSKENESWENFDWFTLPENWARAFFAACEARHYRIVFILASIPISLSNIVLISLSRYRCFWHQVEPEFANRVKDILSVNLDLERWFRRPLEVLEEALMGNGPTLIERYVVAEEAERLNIARRASVGRYHRVDDLPAVV